MAVPRGVKQRIAEAIRESFAAMSSRRKVLDGVERTYLNEKDPEFRGAFTDSRQYPLPMTYVVVDTVASMMMGALQSGDPTWVIKFSELPLEEARNLEFDVQAVFESVRGNRRALDDAIHSCLLLGNAILEMEDVVESTLLPSQIGGKLDVSEVRTAFSGAGERVDDETIRVYQSAGVRAVFHDVRRTFVHPMEVADPVREAQVFGVLRYYAEHEVPSSWWESSDQYPAAGGGEHNDRLTTAVAPATTTKDNRRPFYKGIYRHKDGKSYEFVMNSRLTKLLLWKELRSALPTSRYIFLAAIPQHGRWYAKGLGEMLTPLGNVMSALMSMFMDGVRTSVAPPVRFDSMSHAKLAGRPIVPGDAVAADDAGPLLTGHDPRMILEAMSVFRQFADLVAGTGTAAYGVSSAEGTATGAGIADRASRMRGNKIFDRMRIALADVPYHIVEFLSRHYGIASRLIPLKAQPGAYVFPARWEVNAVSLFSTAEHRQALLMALFDRLIQTVPAVVADPQVMLDLIRNMALVMEVPNVSSFVKELDQRLREGQGTLPHNGGMAEGLAGVAGDQEATGSPTAIDTGGEAETLE